MRERPDAADLLRLARAQLLEGLIERLPEAQRYEARMVANAVAIAARELAAGDEPLKAEHRALAALFGETPGTGAGGQGAEPLDEALERLNWRLAAEIRGGQRDGDAGVYAALRESAIARLRETNPKVLVGEGPD